MQNYKRTLFLLSTQSQLTSGVIGWLRKLLPEETQRVSTKSHKLAPTVRSLETVIPLNEGDYRTI